MVPPFYFMVNLFCSWFQCEVILKPPFILLNSNNTQSLIESLHPKVDTFENVFQDDSLVVHTTAGSVKGFHMNINSTRKIYAFTGVPYGDVPIRFGDPTPRKRWQGVYEAVHPSPFCIQASWVTLLLYRGQEDCLYLDIYTPKLGNRGKRNGQGLPVIIWMPAGANIYGRSRAYGPQYLLREDVILIAINVRFGIFGFLATGDSSSPGNWGLKDQSLAISWARDNVAAFGGDPKRITIGGESSSGYNAHLMLFTNHSTKNFISGIYALSGSIFGNYALAKYDKVMKASNLVAKNAGCPTLETGTSKQMVDCMREMDPYFLATKQDAVLISSPFMTIWFGPVIEPKSVPTAFLTELPETLYKTGRVPPIPLIITRTEDESGLFAPIMSLGSIGIRLIWSTWMPQWLRLGLRHDRIATPEEAQKSLKKVAQFYLNAPIPPLFMTNEHAKSICRMIEDTIYNAPTWKAIELHHQIAPTYAYINKHKSFRVTLPGYLLNRYRLGASHGTDLLLLFNYTESIPPLPVGSDLEIASKNLINFIANFATYGVPYYRTESGELLKLWKPITSMENPLVLDVGLVKEIKMIPDPLVGSKRLQIWEDLIF